MMTDSPQRFKMSVDLDWHVLNKEMEARLALMGLKVNVPFVFLPYYYGIIFFQMYIHVDSRLVLNP